MKSYKDMINEVLTKSTPAGEWIKDFVDSDNPKFAGKSAAKRKEMALAAYYAKQNESVEEAAAVSQNSTAVQDMEAVEYKGIGTDVVDKKKKLNPQPNLTMAKKQVKDFKEEVEQVDESSLHRKHFQMIADLIKGHESAEKRKELAHHHAEIFKKENPRFDHAKFMKAAGVNEEVKKPTGDLKKACWKGYTAIGLKMKDGRKVPNCVSEEVQIDEISKQTADSYLSKVTKDQVSKHGIQPNMYDKLPKNRQQGVSNALKRLIKKEEVQVEEGKVYDPFTKKMVATKPIKVQAGGGATKNGVPVETGPSKYKSKLPMSKAASVLAAEEVELIQKHEVKADAPHKDGGHVILSKAGKNWHVLHNKKSSPSAGDLHRSKLLHSYDDEKTARAKFKELKEEQINELSKDTLASYAKKASKDARIKQHVAADFKSKEAHARNPRKKETWGSIAKKYQSKAWKREDGHDKAVDKLAKEEVQIDEVSKSTLMRYIPKASRDVGSHTYAGKEAGEWANHYTRAGDWSAAEKHSKKSYADFKKANKRIAGIDTATKKLGTQKEEVELDEAAHVYDTKTNKVHSKHDTYNKAIKAAEKLNKEHPGYDTPGNLVRDKFGVKRIDEAIAKKLPVQHAVDAVHATLGPKSATRFLSHLSPGTDKHTSWDKVNNALVKQGVQTHHIASIAQKTSHMNEAYTDKEYQSAINAYLKKGGKVETLPARKPRPGEKTFINRTGSIWKKGYTKSAVSGFNNKSQTTVDDRNKHIREDNETVEESRGHKTLATFFKNREVAQRAYQGNPAKDAEVAQGGGSPADQGIAAAKRDAEELKKKVSEAKTPAVHAALPKKTKSTAKEYASASIPGTKRVAHAKPDDNEVGGGTATRIAEDQYTSEYKIKQFVDPVTGENKQRKVRPHRINFKASKMHGEPAQQDAPGDYGIKEGFDDYSSIAKELVKRHGKNVTAQHVKDFAGERDTHRGLDHAEVMHHVKKLSEDDKVYDEKWKTVKFTDFIKGAK